MARQSARISSDRLGKLLLIGCGNMAGAMLSRWIDAGLDAAQVAVVDPVVPQWRDDAPHPAHFASLAAWQQAGSQADWVLLGTKPQQLGEIAAELSAIAGAGTRLVSMLAGVTLADLAALTPDAAAVVRILPNLPARIGSGVTAVAARGLSGADAKALDMLLAPLGQRVSFDDDSQMDLITAFTGSGPAFILRLIEAYAAAGERLGLPADQALKLANATFAGASALLNASDENPGALIAQVTSKGGTTEAGLDVLDGDGRMVALLTDVLRAARDRGRELADLARPAGN